MIWTLSDACIDMRLLASWFIPFHVKASTRKVVNNREPHDRPGTLATTWTVSQRGDDDAGWIPQRENTFLPNHKQPSSMHYNGRRYSSEPTVGRLTGEQEFPTQWTTGASLRGV